MIHLQECDGELDVDFCRDPDTEWIMHGLCVHHLVHHFIHVVEGQMAVLQQHPSSLCHGVLHEAAGVHLLALSHGDRLTLWKKHVQKRQNKSMEISKPVKM